MIRSTLSKLSIATAIAISASGASYSGDGPTDPQIVAIDAVAGVLIPNARSAELRTALEGAQPLFLARLGHARHASMGGGMGGKWRTAS